MMDIKPEDLQNMMNKKINEVFFKPLEGNKNRWLIRFVPWWKNPKKSIVEKKLFWISNPDTNKVMGFPYSKEINDLYWKIRKHEKRSVQENAKHIRLQKKFISVIQVLNDPDISSNNEKLFLLDYGIQIYEKILNEMDSGNMPFHPYSGNPFVYSFKKIHHYKVYEDSCFINRDASIIIDGKPSVEKVDDERVMKFLKENSPDLDRFRTDQNISEKHEIHLGEFIKLVLPDENTKRIMTML